ncbi:hypothetical protein KEM52_005028 [Ascosphaera acerosa]|nr:hypothetical protein KEM52_005028 [Ascosphaera acerosa]
MGATTLKAGLSAAHVEDATSSSLYSSASPPSRSSDVEAAARLQKEKEQWLALKDDAQAANDAEHETTIWRAILNYRYSLLWSLMVSLSIIMEGYSQNLINNLFGFDPFTRDFGDLHDGVYGIPGPWQSALSCAGMVGAVIGVLANGVVMKRIGYKKSFILNLICMIGFTFITFFAKTLGGQLAGQVLVGLEWGAFATLSPAYSVELCPLAFRPYIAAYTNVCFAAVLQRLTAGEQRQKSKQTVAMMIQTNELEAEAEAGSSYIDCYKGTNRRRTEIACMVFVGQVTSGSQFAYNSSYFFRQAGMSVEEAYNIGLVATAVTFLGTIVSWFLMRAFGRRTIYLSGFVAMCACLIVIGAVATHEDSTGGAKWIKSAFSIIWLLSFSLSVGPVGWTVPAEVGSTRLRSKTICLARISYYLTIIPSSVIEQYMMSPQEWNWKGKTAFFWLAWALLTLLWAYFRLPETKGRTFGELDAMFEKRLPTRDFSSYKMERIYADS